MLKVVSDNYGLRDGDDVLIHVRCLPDGKVTMIDRRPAQLSGDEWRNLLLTEASECYQPFVNARGFFRLPRPVYDSILANAMPMAAE